MRLSPLLASLAIFGVPALALRRRDDQYKGNGKAYENPADKGGSMLTVSRSISWPSVGHLATASLSRCYFSVTRSKRGIRTRIPCLAGRLNA